MPRVWLAMAVLGLFGGCLNFAKDGIYACDPRTGDGCGRDGGPMPADAGLDGGADAGGSDAGLDAGIDGGVPPAWVTGRQVIFSLTGAAEIPVPVDLSSTAISAIVVDGGTVSTYPGVGDADGGFFVAGVPNGVTFYLKRGGYYYITADRDLDLSSWRLGRPKAIASTLNPTTLAFNVTGLPPWRSGSGYQLVSLGAGAMYFSTGYAAANPPATGDTSLNGMAIDFVASRVGLIDGAQGDRAQLPQLVLDTADGGYAYSGVRKVFSPGPFSMTNGLNTLLTGSFADVSARQLAQLDFRWSDFDAQRALSIPDGGNQADTVVYLQVGGLPRGSLHGSYDQLAILAYYYSQGPTPNRRMTFDFANPILGIDLAGVVNVSYSALYSAPGANPTRRTADIWKHDLLSSFTSTPVTPLVTPVLNPRINGVNAFVSQASCRDPGRSTRSV